MLTNGKNGNLRYQILDEFNKHKYMFTNNDGKNTLHLQPYRLFGFCLDCYTETQNSLDRSKLRPSQTPTNHPSEFFGHITFSVPNIKL